MVALSSRLLVAAALLCVARGAPPALRPACRALGAALLSCTAWLGPAPARALEQQGFADQIALIKSQSAERQRVQLEAAEDALLSRELLYPAGRLVARGTATLSEANLNAKDFPLGLSSAALVDEAFGKDSAALIVLAVGRDGPPVAAKKFPLKDLAFPFVFEVTEDDLVFPYTPEAWATSPLSKDTIALTVILNSEGRLSVPSAVQRIGYATSEPLVVAGSNQRSSAKMEVANKIDSALYNAEELKLLAAVDDGIASRATAVPAKR